MPFDTRETAPGRIAVVGGGIAGLGAAWYLSQSHQVTLFEAAPSLGGHARTVVAGRRGDQPVDTGFIVFNRVNYPRLSTLFDELDVATVPSSMSFGASIRGGWLEYALADWTAIFAQRRNLARPAFLRMLADIGRFNAHARTALDGPDMTIGDLTRELRLGDWFRDHYLAPFSGAIWSTPTTRILDFPAEALVRFFENHALMSYGGKHQWETVAGGSRAYVDRLAAALSGRGVDLRPGTPVAAVRRTASGAEVQSARGCETFDEVIFATHSDVTLRLLADPRPVERAALSAIRYQPNEAVLHADPAVMPRRRRCWSSWVYTEGSGGRSERIGLTYWMNSLQPIPADDPMFVTLNPDRPIREELVYDRTMFSHPLYDARTFAAQRALRRINGEARTWYCGAWMHNGFHEDGLQSAWDVVEAISARPALSFAAE